MSCENLYNSLCYNIPTTDLTDSELIDMIEKINLFKKDKVETIYLLILHDYIKTNPTTKVLYPYKSKQLPNNKLEIKLDALPIRLKRILYKFTQFESNNKTEQI